MILPWPPKELSPNFRIHWAPKSRITWSYKAQCYNLARWEKIKVPGGKLIMGITFRPPDRRKRDDDNMIAAFKAGRDGIAQALGIDDSRFSLMVKVGEPVKGGAVEVEIYPETR